MITTIKWFMVLMACLTFVVSCGMPTSSHVPSPSLQGVWVTTTHNHHQTIVLEVQHEGEQIIAASSAVAYACLDFSSVGGKDYSEVYQNQQKADVEIDGSAIQIGLWMFPIDNDGTVHSASYATFDGQLTSPTVLELKTSDGGTIQTYVFHSTNIPPTTIIANATSSYNNAPCTPANPPPRLPTPLPTPSALPLTFMGNGSSVIGADNLFTTTGSWRFHGTCTTSNGGSPYTITVRVWQVLPSSTNGLDDDTASVGKQSAFCCDGQQASSDQTNPGGFPTGTYSLQVVTAGDWKITIEQEQ